MSDVSSQKKSSGLLNYFPRVESSKRTSSSSADSLGVEPSNSVKAHDNDGDTEQRENIDDAIPAGTKRKRAYNKKGTRHSEKINGKAVKNKRHSEPKISDSDSDFEQREITKKPKRKFASVPDGVKTISSYFVLSGIGSHTSKKVIDKNSTEEIEVVGNGILKIVKDCNNSENKEINNDCNNTESSETEVIDDCNSTNTDDSEIAQDSISETDVIEVVENGVNREGSEIEIEEDDVNSQKKSDVEIVEGTAEETPTRRRSSRIQIIEERKGRELEEKMQVTPTANRPRRRKRMQITDSDSEKSVAVESEESSNESSDFIADSDDEDFEKRRKSKRKSKKVAGKIPLMFLTGKEREKELLRLKKEKKPTKPELNAETLAFLQSGVPDVVLKAQKQVEKKMDYDDFLSTVAFFPKTSHTGRAKSEDEINAASIVSYKGNPIIHLSDDNASFNCSWKDVFVIKKDTDCSETLANGMFCCGNTSFAGLSSALKVKTSSDSSGVPWLEKYKVSDKKDLVVNKEAFGIFEKWLKQWKTDIKDDGGTGRKEVRKRRKDSDSDFVTSEDEEQEFMNKSVLLCGSTGCGKTTAVYVLAKQLGFYVVEVNFSSRRSGKEVLQRVEEATLSHRLESSESCLLLFKDIDLLHPEEDEGFHAAVAQLIGSSCRPIVMTTQQETYSPLDSKIEKKDPLRIYFDRPSSSEIVKKVLLPMCKSLFLKSKTSAIDEKLLSSGLDSVVRHLHCDIRLCINQTQFLCYDNFFSSHNIHKHCNLKEPSFDLDFICKSKETKVTEGDAKISQRKLVSELDRTCRNLAHLSDLEFISSNAKKCYDYGEGIASHFSMNICEYLDLSSRSFQLCHKDTSKNVIVESGSKENVFNSRSDRLDGYRKLSLLNDEEATLSREIDILNDELASYCDAIYDWQTWGCVRTIVKTNAINSVGRSAKRNGRMAFYFNRLEKSMVNRICETFGFAEYLEAAKVFAPE